MFRMRMWKTLTNLAFLSVTESTGNTCEDTTLDERLVHHEITVSSNNVGEISNVRSQQHGGEDRSHSSAQSFKRRLLAALNKLIPMTEQTAFALSHGSHLLDVDSSLSRESKLVTQGHALHHVLAKLCDVSLRLRALVSKPEKPPAPGEIRGCTICIAAQLANLADGLSLNIEGAASSESGWAAPEDIESIDFVDGDLANKMCKLQLRVQRIENVYTVIYELRTAVYVGKVLELESVITRAKEIGIEGPDLSAAFCALRKARQLHSLHQDLQSSILTAEEHNSSRPLTTAIQKVHGFLLSTFPSNSAASPSLSLLRETFRKAQELQGKFMEREGVLHSLEQLNDTVDIAALRQLVEKAQAVGLSMANCPPLEVAERRLRQKQALESVHSAACVLSNCLKHMTKSSRFNCSESIHRSGEKLENCLSLCVMLGQTRTLAVQQALVHQRHWQSSTLLLSQSSLARIPVAQTLRIAAEMSSLFEKVPP
jgi:hypothetical protein